MGKYCGNCGTQMAQDEKFCAICGTKFEINLKSYGVNHLKPLTSEVIKKDLHLQKSSKWGYIFIIAFLLFTSVMSVIGHPIGLVMVAMLAYSLIKMILHDSRISKFRYTIVERICVGLRYIPDGEGADEWKLEFKDINNVRTKSMSVDESFYNATKTGDEFYVVFLGEEKSPCLCYRKSEWIM